MHSAGAQEPRGWKEICSWHSVRSACSQAAASVRAVAGKLLQGSVRRAFLLLLFIWFANALDYYGLVLLTTTVSCTLAASLRLREHSVLPLLCSLLCRPGPAVQCSWPEKLGSLLVAAVRLV